MSAFRDHNPRGATAKLVEAAGAKYGAPFVASWLSATTCRFTDTTIFTTGLGEIRIRQYCEDLMREHGVAIVVCPDVTRGLYAQVDGKAKP